RLAMISQLGVPKPAGGKIFFTKREGKQNQPVLYVRLALQAPRVLIDVNKLAADGTTALDWHFPSNEGELLAYGISVGGNEQSTLHLLNVDTGRELTETIPNTRACSVAWLPDASGFYYTRYPSAGSVPKGEENYHRRIYFHKIGDDPSKDREIFGAGRS